MLYTRPTFTCPTANNVSQVKWDLAMLSPRRFQRKYDINNGLYDLLVDKSISLDDIYDPSRSQ